jgi:hypothetical protein
MDNQSLVAFPSEVIEKLGFYAYRLIDPRTGETFYVGKGKGNRVFQHARGVPGERWHAARSGLMVSAQPRKAQR